MLSWGLLCRVMLVISLLFLAIPIHLDAPQDVQAMFNRYCQDFNKSCIPNTDDYTKRFEIFKKTLMNNKAFNDLGHHPKSAKYGLTEFSDMSESEFIATHLNKTRKYHNKHHHHKSTDDSDESNETIQRQTILNGLPMEVDWRNKGIISTVKDQGLCGACWAFSTVQTIEAMYARKHKFTPLSVQQIVDCAANGNHGCLGGDICSVVEWISDNDVTIETEQNYPYLSEDNTCRMKNLKKNKKIHIKTYSCQNLINNEKLILRWLAKNGPVAVAVNALSWQNYVEGVIQYNCDDNPLSLNHAIQLVGYNLNAEIPYYIGKNSWGTAYGDNGYIYLAIGKNTCGLANEVVMIDVI